MVSAAIAPVIQRYLGEVERAGIPVEAAVLFGSYAKGLEREDSDIDLVVLSPRFDQQKTQHDISVLWRLRARTDARIEPIAAGVREFAEDEGSPILCVARAEGIRIPYAAER
jgi:predicted nucleotidyltransferase